MFENIQDLENFLIFCHTHFELNDVWNNNEGDKGILFEGWHHNETKSQRYSPDKLDEEVPYRKRRTTDEMYKLWQQVKTKSA